MSLVGVGFQQVADGLCCCPQLVSADELEDEPANVDVADVVVEHDQSGASEDEGGGVQVGQGREAVLAGRSLGAREQVAGDGEVGVGHVVVGVAMELVSERRQRRQSAV